MGVRFEGEDIVVPGNVRRGGSIIPGVSRDEMLQDDLKPFTINPMDWRVHDAIQTNLPGTSASDDLGLYGGTYGTDPPRIRTYDVKAAGALTLRARCVVQLPAEYVAGQTVLIRAHCGMITNQADTSCTIDFEAWKIDRDNSLGAADLVATSATSMNSTTFDDKDFTVTASGLEPGDALDVRMTIAVNDGATGTAVIAAVDQVELRCDVKG